MVTRGSPPPFQLRLLGADANELEAGEAEGHRYVTEGHDVRPWYWPISPERATEFADGFRIGVLDAELARRGQPNTTDNMIALGAEWGRGWQDHIAAQQRKHRESSTVLWHIDNEFDPLATFSGVRSTGPAKVLNLCAGPGGWDEAARILGAPAAVYGIDNDPDACNTARAAGFMRHQADITTFDPRMFTAAAGVIVSPPCPTFSAAGKATATHDYDVQEVLDAITGLGSNDQYYTDPATLRASVSDPRTALAFEIARWGFLAPDLDWIVAENVPAIRTIYEDLTGEMESFGWNNFDFVTLKADSFGGASRRERSFFMASKSNAVSLSLPYVALPPTTMRAALKWPAGEQINTRGERKTSGGNEFSADQVAWCLTEKARTWARVSDGRRLSASEAGLLNGFPPDYPWRGSRSKQFLQIADVVNPLVGAAVLGDVMGIAWQDLVVARVKELYGTDAGEEIQAEAPHVDPQKPLSRTPTPEPQSELLF